MQPTHMILHLFPKLMTGSSNMETLSFHELKKQTSFFLKEKFRAARLAFTNVTPTELLAEEVMNGNPWPPEARTMGVISRAAFEVDDYWRVVEILHKRLSRFDRKHWRESYYALILLEHLLMHGPQSFSEEFQSDKDVIKEAGSFHYVDGRGFDWGLSVRKKSERILMLLEKGCLLKEERDRARELTRRISRNSSSITESCAVNNQKENLDLGNCCLRNAKAEENKKDFGQKFPKENTHGKNRVVVEGLGIEFEKADHPFSFLEHYTRESLLSGQT